MRKLIDATRHNLRNLAHFGGRERRGTFWRYVLVLYVAQMALSTIVSTTLMVGMFGRRGSGPFTSMFETIVLLTALGAALFVLLLAASAVRRLHDSGRSGWWILLPLPFLAIGLWGMQHLRSSIGAGGDPVLSFGLLMASNLVYLALLGLLVFLLARPGNAGPNRFGANPREG